MNPGAKSIRKPLPSAAGILDAIADAGDLQKRILELAFEMIPAKQGVFLLNGQISTAFEPDSEVLARVYSDHAPFMKAGPLPVICAPVMDSGAIRGILYMYGAGSDSGFQDDDLLNLKDLADIAAAGLRLARRIELLEDERDLFRDQIEPPEEIIGESDEFQYLRWSIQNAARSNKPVLIFAGPATNHMVIAKSIHHMSGRASRPFVPIDCDGIGQTELTSALFGHVKDAFPGATKTSKGKILKADGGTVLLRRLEALPLEIKARLQRLFEDGTFEPMGSDRSVKVDTRVIGHTTTIWSNYVGQPRFPETLFERFDALMIAPLGLRAGSDDIRRQAIYFLNKFGPPNSVFKISEEAIQALTSFTWLGDDLEQVIHSAVLVANAKTISVKDLPFRLTDPESAEDNYWPEPEPKPAGKLQDVIDRTSRSEIERALKESPTRADAAKRLNLSPATLYRRMRRFGL